MTNLIIAILLSLNICLNPCCTDDVDFIEKYGVVTNGTVTEKSENFVTIEINGQLENWYLDDELNNLELNENVLIVGARIIDKNLIKDLQKGID